MTKVERYSSLPKLGFIVYNAMYRGGKEKAMAEMVRKQIYIEERHERLLKRISKARGVSEAELIRQAIEREAVGEKHPLSPDQEAWDKILCFAKSRKTLRRSAQPYCWNRLDAYEERERRFPKLEKGKS